MIVPERSNPGIQFRCPECGVIVQNRHPDAQGEWVAWCPNHGTVSPVSGESYQPDNDEEDLYE